MSQTLVERAREAFNTAWLDADVRGLDGNRSLIGMEAALRLVANELEQAKWPVDGVGSDLRSFQMGHNSGISAAAAILRGSLEADDAIERGTAIHNHPAGRG